jgi:hypothetical protein
MIVRRRSFISPELSSLDRRGAQAGEAHLVGIRKGRIGTLSRHGVKPAANGSELAKINQDRGFIAYPLLSDPQQALLCVFDGHGGNGEQVRRPPAWRTPGRARPG